jgi:hypothetical protein
MGGRPVDDVDLSVAEFLFYGMMMLGQFLIIALVLLAVAYGFVRVVLAAWDHVSPSAAEGSRPSPAPVESPGPVKRRDDFYGRHRGDRQASRPTASTMPPSS